MRWSITRRRNIMRDLKYLKKAIIGTIFGAIVLVGTVLSINAQNSIREYRDWQMAQARAEQLHQDYLRTRSGWDYMQWQAAERRAQQQYTRYQQTASSYNNGYNNNGYNNGYHNNNRYYKNTRYNNKGQHN